LQKLKRIQPSVESSIPTAWTLVDKRQRSRPAASVVLVPAVAPAGGADLVDVAARPVAPGTQLRTGETCPTSGWWRCEEPKALDGTRWFAQGSVLPAATFQVPAGVFAKSAGPEFIQRRSAWRLMRPAATPASPRAPATEPDGSDAGEPPALV
jgi:hypothetical protein